MKKLLPGSVALVACGICGLSYPALAADLGLGVPSYKAAPPVMHAYDWTGFYLGGNVGGHFGSDKVSTTTDVDFEGLGPFAGAAIDSASSTTLHPEGFIAGIQGGYNLEGSGGVFGIEVDANWLGGSASRSLSNIGGGINPADVLTNTTQANFLSTLRMRWGTTVISDRLLLFITGGFAFETIKTTDSMGHNGNTTITSVTNSTTEPGWTAGGGFEYAFTDNFSAKVEYLFVGLKNPDITIPSTGAFADSIVVVHNYSEQVARFGLNFKFGGWGG